MNLYETIAAVNLDAVPVVCTDRHIDRKEQAVLTRKLFKQLGIKGVSVTTPRYSMASTVEVRVPAEPFPGWVGFEQWQHHSYGDMPDDVPAKAAARRQQVAAEKVEAILAKAFPRHDDRSDYQTDYSDSCWTIR